MTGTQKSQSVHVKFMNLNASCLYFSTALLLPSRPWSPIPADILLTFQSQQRHLLGERGMYWGRWGRGAEGREYVQGLVGEHLGRGQDGDGSVVVKRLLEEVILQARSFDLPMSGNDCSTETDSLDPAQERPADQANCLPTYNRESKYLQRGFLS